MKSIKLLAIAVPLALIAVAFVATASATATSTVLCKVNEEPCAEKNQVEILESNLTAGTVATILNNIANVLCLEVTSVVELSGLGSPEFVTGVGGGYNACGTNSSHNNCTITPVGGSPVSNLLKTGTNIGLLTAESGEVSIECTIFGFLKINCVYQAEGLENTVEGALRQGAETGHGMVIAAKQPASLLEGSGLCPAEATTDYLLEPSEHVYIVS